MLSFDYYLARPSRRFQFDKRSQLFIRTHNEAFPVIAMRVTIQIVRPSESNG
jgi:hypothetical protein